MYRDKEEIFFKSSGLLRLICRLPEVAQELAGNADMVRRLEQVEKLLARRDSLNRKSGSGPSKAGCKRLKNLKSLLVYVQKDRK